MSSASDPSSVDASASPALVALGWSPFFQAQIQALCQPLFPARVAVANRGRCHLLGPLGPFEAVVAGRLAHVAPDDASLPVVGDWVLVRAPEGADTHTVVDVLVRRTCFARKSAGKRLERQVVAANVDRVLAVMSFDRDLNVRRLERYLMAVAASGAEPAIVLGKADLAENAGECAAEVRATASGAPVFVVSALRGDGMDELRAFLRAGETATVVGSSGVGKSALLNRLLGEERQTLGAVREHDGRGKHTTTHRELFVLPGGALLIDTPGMRELGLWGEGDGRLAFEDIETLAAACRFRDCAHRGEPGCRVAEAIDEGALPPERLASYEKLGRELERLHRSQDGRARHEERRRRQRFARSVRARPKRGGDV